MKDVTKFTLWRDVGSEKLRMLQERSDSLIQPFPGIQQRSEATKNSVPVTLQIDFLTSTPGQQSVVMKVQPCLLRLIDSTRFYRQGVFR